MHLRYGPPPCDECRKANAAKTAERRAQMVDCVECGRHLPLYAYYRCHQCSKRYAKTKPKKRGKGAPPLSVERTDLLGGEAAVPDPGPAQPDLPSQA